MRTPAARTVAVAIAVAYLLGGTVLTVAALDSSSELRAALLLALALALLFAAAFAAGWWAIALPFVTLWPVGAWSHARCEPDFFNFCEALVWHAAVVGVVVFGLPVTIAGAWLGRRSRRQARAALRNDANA